PYAIAAFRIAVVQRMVEHDYTPGTGSLLQQAFSLRIVDRLDLCRIGEVTQRAGMPMQFEAVAIERQHTRRRCNARVRNADPVRPVHAAALRNPRWRVV